ncbi:hypothetical protein PHYSODRAFT_329111 [Phytophthora sojae]|uniref:Uncharacterized protein n=1 Tax=Phytophthora sojae (strain P6497) TaxID=1094619 RepID=G4Z7P0_PHYSP|nr:hypothetical protein PHYSODRAFT_329111 [Phytophthora sojae]EGZ21079.1 hypothetical protein PHYSODRAFT_329111 [Phytophthora sojae]|eukprot:XP_009523796.1 hypothetical protein PHYSODRAFT_329111 [Phytophthora sojae]
MPNHADPQLASPTLPAHATRLFIFDTVPVIPSVSTDVLACQPRQDAAGLSSDPPASVWQPKRARTGDLASPTLPAHATRLFIFDTVPVIPSVSTDVLACQPRQDAAGLSSDPPASVWQPKRARTGDLASPTLPAHATRLFIFDTVPVIPSVSTDVLACQPRQDAAGLSSDPPASVWQPKRARTGDLASPTLPAHATRLFIFDTVPVIPSVSTDVLACQPRQDAAGLSSDPPASVWQPKRARTGDLASPTLPAHATRLFIFDTVPVIPSVSTDVLACQPRQDAAGLSSDPPASLASPTLPAHATRLFIFDTVPVIPSVSTDVLACQPRQDAAGLSSDPPASLASPTLPAHATRLFIFDTVPVIPSVSTDVLACQPRQDAAGLSSDPPASVWQPKRARTGDLASPTLPAHATRLFIFDTVPVIPSVSTDVLACQPRQDAAGLSSDPPASLASPTLPAHATRLFIFDTVPVIPSVSTDVLACQPRQDAAGLSSDPPASLASPTLPAHATRLFIFDTVPVIPSVSTDVLACQPRQDAAGLSSDPPASVWQPKRARTGDLASPTLPAHATRLFIFDTVPVIPSVSTDVLACQPRQDAAGLSSDPPASLASPTLPAHATRLFIFDTVPVIPSVSTDVLACQPRQDAAGLSSDPPASVWQPKRARTGDLASPTLPAHATRLFIFDTVPVIPSVSTDVLACQPRQDAAGLSSDPPASLASPTLPAHATRLFIFDTVPVIPSVSTDVLACQPRQDAAGLSSDPPASVWQPKRARTGDLASPTLPAHATRLFIFDTVPVIPSVSTDVLACQPRQDAAGLSSDPPASLASPTLPAHATRLFIFDTVPVIPSVSTDVLACQPRQDAAGLSSDPPASVWQPKRARTGDLASPTLPAHATRLFIFDTVPVIPSVSTDVLACQPRQDAAGLSSDPPASLASPTLPAHATRLFIFDTVPVIPSVSTDVLACQPRQDAAGLSSDPPASVW